MARGKEETPDAVETSKPVKIIWQSPRGPNAKLALVTLNEIDESTGRLKAFAEIKPNVVGQYVLEATARLWHKQVDAMKSYAEKYGLIPIGVKDEGLIPKNIVILPDLNAPVDEVQVSTLKASLAEAQRVNAELMKKVAEADAKSGANKGA